ncbi:MAG TPA: NUDIX domain-containing protein [Gaiellaceae bacterium]|jgi:ADP-ribose pyrophosphatase YjhB (NUDIX family)|nr:NUDIX domain-containing protein [Gaiellaceae bacterium]
MRIRDAVRAIVLDPDDRTVLVLFDFGRRTVWATPGGGTNPGESDEEALRRELAEEVGLEGPEIGPHVWIREHLFQDPLGDYAGQRERYYVVRTDRFELKPHLSPEQLREEYVTGVRWWTIDEIEASRETFAPADLGDRLRALVTQGAPDEPIEVGV